MFTPGSLRALITMVDYLDHQSQPEDCHSESISTPIPVEDLQPRNPQSPDPTLGRSTSSSSTSPSAALPKRRHR
jgi:hypothetical protein